LAVGNPLVAGETCDRKERLVKASEAQINTEVATPGLSLRPRIEVEKGGDWKGREFLDFERRFALRFWKAAGKGEEGSNRSSASRSGICSTGEAQGSGGWGSGEVDTIKIRYNKSSDEVQGGS
jgi:hypothetical protein